MVGAMGEGVSSDAYMEYVKRTFDLDVRDAFFKRVGAYLLQKNDTGNGALNSAVSPRQNKNSTDKELAGAFWTANEGHLVSDRDGPNLRAFGAYSAMFAGFSQATSLAGSSELISPVFSKEGRQFGVIMLVTRDAKPVSRSRRLLLTISGATTGSQPDIFPARPKNLIAYPGDRGWWTLEPDTVNASKPSGPRDATGPVWLERINVTFFYPSNAQRMVIYPLDPDGQRLAPVPRSDIVKTDRGFKVSLNKSSPWYEVLLAD